MYATPLAAVEVAVTVAIIAVTGSVLSLDWYVLMSIPTSIYMVSLTMNLPGNVRDYAATLASSKGIILPSVTTRMQ